MSSPSSTSPQVSALSTSHLALPPSANEYHERRRSLSKPQSTEKSDVENISNAIEAAEPLDMEQLHLFERLIKWEADALADELTGKATDPAHYYPNNLTFQNHYEYIVLPTVVYELQYPRSDSIKWSYVAEKACALIGVIFVMIMISQAFIYPVVMRTVYMKETGWTTAQRFQEFPWVLSDLIFPFMMEYLVSAIVVVRPLLVGFLLTLAISWRGTSSGRRFSIYSRSSLTLPTEASTMRGGIAVSCRFSSFHLVFIS